MKDERKTKAQLVDELVELRRRITALEASEAERLSAARLPDEQEQAGKRADDDLRRRAEELARTNAELERFNRLAVGRELRMIELKSQINELSEQLGKEAPYDVSFAEKED